MPTEDNVSTTRANLSGSKDTRLTTGGRKLQSEDSEEDDDGEEVVN